MGKVVQSARIPALVGCMLGLATLSLFCPIPSALAATGPWVSGGTVRARLIAATNGVGQGNEVPAGIQVTLNDGWDTYWRSPGDAGAPPRADWSGSSNLGSVDWRWPAPTRFTLFGLETFGYTHEVVFPLTLHPTHANQPITLRGRLDLLVCSDICVPKTLMLLLDMPAGPATADPEAANLIARFESKVPDRSGQSGLTVDGLSVDPRKPASLLLRIASREELSAPEAIVESDRWTFGKPSFAFAPDRRTATAHLPVTSGPDAVTLPGSRVTVTLEDGMRASEAALVVGRASAGSESRIGELVPIIGIALLGGLILNLMPCVLPVLSLKLTAALRYQGQAQRRIRLGFLATAAGVITSMLLLGGVLAALKAGGLAVGWGLQFQQPAFLIFMAAALALFAGNLAGAFEIPLPARLATPLSRALGDGLTGAFLAGAFTTILATPCSAPFVGTAVAFALARGTGEILSIFAALGAGLAAPHLLVAAFPGLTRLLPRPGRWMITLRRVLSLALAGTAAWLLAVLAGETSFPAAIAVASALVLLVASLAFRRRLGLPATAACVALALIAAAASPEVLRAATSAAAARTAWARFDEPTIKALVAEGKVVFVDVTADWCVNCQVNKALVLERPDVARELAGPGVVPMLADWTRPNSRISDYLARNNRYGIPFNAVYGPGAPRGIVLPEVLTRAAVLEALRSARQSANSAR